MSRGLLAGKQPIRERIARRLHLAEELHVLVERHLLGPVPPPPPPLPVARLVHHDAVDPGPKRRLAAEGGNGAEDAQEDFLRQVERLVAVAEKVQGQAKHHALMDSDEFRACGFVALTTARDQGGFATVDIRPAKSARVLHQCSGTGYLHEV
jgi:hypothetical protein